MKAIEISGVITDEKIKAIQSSASCDLFIHDAVCRGPLVLENYHLRSIRLHNVKTNDYLLIKNCQIETRVTCSSIKPQTTISFLDSDIGGDLIFHDILSGQSLELHTITVGGSLTLDQAIFSCITIHKCRMREFSLLPVERQNKIGSIRLASSEIQSDTTFSGLDNVHELKIENSFLHGLKIVKSTLQDAVVCIEETRLGTLRLSGVILQGTTKLRMASTDIEMLFMELAASEQATVDCVTSIVSKSASFQVSMRDDSRIDISSSDFAQLRLHHDLARSSLDYPNSPLFHPEDSIQCIATIKLIKEMYFKEHDYWTEDRFFYLLKTVEQKALVDEFLQSGNIKHLFLWLLYIMFRFIFGWGVDLFNPLAAMAVLMICFSGLYEWAAYVSHHPMLLHIMHTQYSGFFAALILSIAALLNLDPLEATLGSLGPLLYFSEFFFGLLMVTLIIGIIIRKLVR
ncbi:hypothetical protein [Acidithiobacillus ferrianus]|uniref:hypothetical protein n=1 Tax=Acidithiobacillus ferrianus TaxID=2678518 RepID=UPI0034E5FF55